MESSHKFSLGYFLAVLLLMLLIQSLLAPRLTEISYAEFKADLSQDKIKQLTIGETLIRGQLKPDAVTEGQSTSFTTVRVTDPELVKELQAHQVDFSGQYESPFAKAFLTHIPHPRTSLNVFFQVAWLSTEG